MDGKNIIISYGNRIDKPNCQQKTLNHIIEQIKNPGSGLKSNIAEIRAYQDISERQKKKRETLPYFTFNKFKSNYRSKENFLSAEYLILDFDHIEGNKLLKVKEELMGNPAVLFVFLSPGGDGLKVGLKLDTEVKEVEEYSSVFSHYALEFEKEYGIEVGREFDAARACFISYDPDIYVRYNASSLSTKIPDQTSVTPKEKLYNKVVNGVKAGERTPSLASLIGKHIEAGFDEDYTLEIAKLLNAKNSPPLSDEKVKSTVSDLYKRYKRNDVPVKFIIKNNSYYKKNGGNEKQITSFIIHPKTLINLQESDCLICDIETFRDKTYTDITITNTDWHTKQKFLKALGKSDCTFTGSDNDLQLLCQFIQSQEFDEKEGTKVIGLFEDKWVVKDCNINKDGSLPEPEVIPYEKGGDAFINRISYNFLDVSDFTITFGSFYDHILNVNKAASILPYIGWIFSTPVKPIIKKYSGSFPLLFNHGGFGSGKTSLSEIFARLVGYADPKPNSCTLRSFPMLKLLGSTNAIPLWFDEFKLSDMTTTEQDSLLRYMRRIYGGEIETKGKQDQTVEEYQLLAPMAVMGEWAVTQPALLERVILIRSQNVIKNDSKMQRAFRIIKDLNLEGFMPEYIKFLLNQDIEKLLKDSEQFVIQILKNIPVAARIKNNLSVMVLGLELFRMFAHHNRFIVPEINYETLIKEQLSEITGGNTGSIKSGVDQMMEFLSSLASNDILKPEEDYKFIGNDTLAINFNKIYPNFKMYAHRVKYEGDLLNKDAYLKMFEETPYVIDKSKVIRFGSKSVRCILFDIRKIENAELEIDGFNGYNCYGSVTPSCNEKSPF